MSDDSQSLYNDAGIHQSGDASVIIAYTEWNDLIVRELVAGCEKKLAQYGVKKINKIQVPGAFELAFACRRYYEAYKDSAQRPDVI
ncbi:MAG TPA: 6,7-dimethyl-8-ribityllumazine synthase, partial [Chitinophagaceae bacterium]